jgi:hypothetical protein
MHMQMNILELSNDIHYVGRGTICSPKGNFVFDMKTTNGVASGTITFLDFTNSKTISGVVTSLYTNTLDTATFNGTATINGVPNISFSVDLQRNPGYMLIKIPSLSYSSGGNICSGTIDP